MRLIEEIRENLVSRVGNARIKVTAKQHTSQKHPDNNNADYIAIPNESIASYNKARPRKQKLLCYAPFKNMYFGMNGSATACCYNRTHVFGKFPDQSIHEMWFGEKVQLLGDYMKCNDLSLGCDGCQYQLEAGNYTGTQAMYFDHYPVNENNYPSVMQFEMSNTCNLECGMCSGEFSSLIRKNREKLPPIKCVYNDEFINQLREFIPHLSYAKFYGGEPFLIDQYYHIWNLMAELNPTIKVEIQTNATVLNQKVRTVLEKLKCNINISIDSLQKNVYESIRVNANFDLVQKNIQEFVNYSKKKGTRLTISMCPMRNNWEELPEYVHFANNIQANLFFHVVWNPEHLALWNLDSTSLDKTYQTLASANLPGRTTVQRKNRERFLDYLNLIKEWRRKAFTLEKEKEMLKKEKERIENEKRIKLESYSNKARHYAPLLKEHGVEQTIISELKNLVLRDEKFSNADVNATVKHCIQQLAWLSDNLPEDIIPDELYTAMLIQRPIKNIFKELQRKDKNELLKIAVAFANKMEHPVLYE